MDLMRCLSEFPKIKTIVLTRLLNPLAQILADEHENDKRAWCLEHALTPVSCFLYPGPVLSEHPLKRL